MKINWGTGIAVAIVAFIGFIMYFVVTMMTGKEYDHDLVTEQYYQKELKYQDEIDALQNAKDLEEPVRITKTADGLLIKFPEIFTEKNTKGKVFLYRPSNKQLDFEMPLSISNTYLLVPETRLLDGRWNISILWNHKNKHYLVKEEIIY